MARPARPDRIHLARRAAIRNGLTDRGMSLENAERWCDAWELEAERQGLERASPDYWRAGAKWIDVERSVRKVPRDAEAGGGG
jgi:hypothetical protein